jgi:hypothetical protein
MFVAETGSKDQRGRMFGNLRLDTEIDAFLAVSELVVVRGTYVEREEYAYYLVIDGVETWGHEKDPTHEPPLHRHTEGHRERLVADEVSFKAMVEMAWDEVTERARLTVDDA